MTNKKNVLSLQKQFKNKQMNQKELEYQIIELNIRVEKSKEDRSVENYALKPYYEANEKYIQMLEKKMLELIEKLPNRLIQTK